MATRVKMPKKRQAPASHNSALSAKVELRRWLISELHGRPSPTVRVLDCFCAGGVLWERAYGRPGAESYLGLDTRRFDDERRTIVTDSRRFLRHRDVALESWDLFDLDAFGSPLEHLCIIAHRLRVPAGRRVGFALTDGTGFNAKMNSNPRGLLAYVGMAPHRGAGVQHAYRSDIFNACVTKALGIAHLRLVDSRSSVRAGSNEMRYVALLTEGL